MHTSTHSIPFEHKYKVGDVVWYYNDFKLDEGFYSGTIKSVEYDPDNGQITYFISGPGYVIEEDLFKSRKEMIKHEFDRLSRSIDIEAKSISNLKFAAQKREENLEGQKEKLESLKKLLSNCKTK